MTLTRFDYTDTYRIGVPDLDQQHARFFEMYNALVDRLACGGGMDASELASVYNDLFLYTKYHFREEEWVMKTSRYPGLREHLTQHQKFIDQLMAMRRGGVSPGDMMANIQTFVRYWAEHILVADRALGAYLQER